MVKLATTYRTTMEYIVSSSKLAGCYQHTLTSFVFTRRAGQLKHRNLNSLAFFHYTVQFSNAASIEAVYDAV